MFTSNHNQSVTEMFSPSNLLVIASISVQPDISSIQQAITDVKEWEITCEKLIKKGVAGLFLAILEKHPEINTSVIPHDVVTKLNQAYLKTITRSMVLYAAFSEVIEKLNHKQIKVVALKGVYVAEHFYPKIGLRQFSDIDLLVRKEDIPEILSIMKELRFDAASPAYGTQVTSIFESAHLPPYIRKGVSIELHTRLHGPTHNYTLDENDMFTRAEPVTINKESSYAFELYDQLIHLCTHLDKHMNGSMMQFYSFADIVRILHQKDQAIDFKLLLDRSRSYKAEDIVKKQLLLAHQLFGAPLPQQLIQGQTKKADPELIKLLTNHLENRVSHESATKNHLYYIRRIKSPFGKFEYLLAVLFPGKGVMVRAYKIKKPQLYWLWYPYRIWIGFKGFFWKNK